MSWQAIIMAVACWVGIILLLAAIENTKAWERFKGDNHCKPINARLWHCDADRELTR